MNDIATDEPTAIQLIVGLGNPGRKYRDTRHNVGFMVVDRLAEKYQVSFKPESRWKAEVAKVPGSDVWLVKPLTFMNLSGESIGALTRFRKLSAAGVLLVYDDLDLPLGRLRIRTKGSAGGHNGVKSAIQHLRTDSIPRIKVGIGRTAEDRARGEVVGRVLGKFSPDERSALENSLDRAIDAVLCSCKNGVMQAMNTFNGVPKSDGDSEKPRKS